MRRLFFTTILVILFLSSQAISTDSTIVSKNASLTSDNGTITYIRLENTHRREYKSKWIKF